MAWQDLLPVSSPRIAAEEDRELRLVAQARAGADWALTALVARYQPPVTRYLTRLTGNADLARALAEQVFIRMERRLHGPEGGRHLRLWLLRASTETGLDALRQPTSKVRPQLTGTGRPVGLLTAAGGAAALERLKMRLGTLAQAAAQTRRQVRRLIWSPTPDAMLTADFDAVDSATRHPTPPMFDEAAGIEHDPREALRFRMVRAVLAELPYGDAQCVALHLVAGLNQAEVAAALGLTNSATRRRIVQGLQLFAQRFNAAAASLGISPDALASDEPHPLEPGVGGYVAVQEQPTESMISPYAAAERAELAPRPLDEEPWPMAAAVGGVDSAGEDSPGVVDALPVVPAESMLPGGPAPVEAAQPEDGDDTTLPAALLAATVARVMAEHEEGAPPAGEAALAGPTFAAHEAAHEIAAGDGAWAATPADDTEGTAGAGGWPPAAAHVLAALPADARQGGPAESVRLVPVVTPGAETAAAVASETAWSPQARTVPVLTPQPPRQRVDTLPRRRGIRRDTPILLRSAGSGASTPIGD